MALTSNRRSLQPLLDAGWVRLGEDELKPMRYWSDDYINPLEPLWEGVKLRYRGWKLSPRGPTSNAADLRKLPAFKQHVICQYANHAA